MFLIYDSYKLNQNNTYDKQIKQIVVINKEFMNNNLQYIKKEVKQTEAIFLKIENELKKMYIDDNTNVINVKDELSNRFDLKKQELSLEVFKINKDYKIIDSSNTFDINYYISINKNEKKTLSKITKVHVLKQSPGVFFDAFDQTIKKYAFFKLKDSSYLGISIIFEFSKKHKEAFKNLVISLHTKLNYRYVIRDSNKVDYTMKFFMRADEFSSRAEYYEKLYKNNELDIETYQSLLKEGSIMRRFGQKIRVNLQLAENFCAPCGKFLRLAENFCNLRKIFAPCGKLLSNAGISVKY